MATALVVDDSLAMRRIIGRLLRRFGIDVHEAQDGQDALDRLEEIGPPDVMLVDWNMPNMTGYEFLRVVRNDPLFDESRVMMVTSESEMHRVSSALAAGADEYVTKPFTEDILVEKLDMLGIDVEAA